MSDVLNIAQLKKLQEVLIERLESDTIRYEEGDNISYLEMVNVSIRKMTTEILRDYLSKYQKKSPICRIHKIRTKKVVKETISDENLERLRDHCIEKRDLAMIDLLVSTGMSVGELVNLDIGDLDFEERECVVYGKGDNWK